MHKKQKIMILIMLIIPFLGYSCSASKRRRVINTPYLPVNYVQKVLKEFSFCDVAEKGFENKHILTTFSSNGNQPIVTVLIYDSTDLKAAYKNHGSYNYSQTDLERLSVLKSWIDHSFFKGISRIPDERSRDMSIIIQELSFKNIYKGPFDMVVMREYERIKKLPLQQMQSMITSLCRKNTQYPQAVMQLVYAHLLPKNHTINTIAYPERWMTSVA